MLSDSKDTPLFHLMKAANRAPADSEERQTLAKKIMEEPDHYKSLVEQASKGDDRAQQLDAKNRLLWLQQQAKG